MESFVIDRFQSLEYDPVHGMLAAVRASDDKAVALYKIVGGEKWHVVPCGEIQSPAGVATVAWMQEEILPCLAVGDRRGRLAVFALDNTAVDRWAAVAAFQGGRASAAVDVAYANSCLVCSSGRLAGIVGSNVQDPTDGRIQRLGKALLGAAGPLPLYHPAVLRALVLSGHVRAFFEVLGALKSWLEAIDSDALDSFDSLECCSRESCDLASPSAVQRDRARTMPHMFPGISPANVIAHSDSDISKTLERLREVFDGDRRDDAREVMAGTAATAETTAMAEMAEMSVTAATPTMSHESGMLDFGAFGMGMPAIEAEPKPEPRPEPAPPAAPSFESGMLDMSSFGMEVPAASAAPPAASASLHETGMLDMAAFGMGTPSMPSMPSMSPIPSMPEMSPSSPSSSQQPAAPVARHFPSVTTASDTTRATRTIALDAAAKISCSEYLTLLDHLVSKMQSPHSASSARYIPGLRGDESQRLDDSIRKTKDVLSDIRRDVDIPTLVFLVSFAWGASDGKGGVSTQTSRSPGSPDLDADPSSSAGRKPSFVNAAGVPMDYGRLKQDQDKDAQMRANAPEARGLSAALGLGPRVSPEALVWMCLSSQDSLDGSHALDVARRIQGDMCGGEASTNPAATNGKNAFLAVPRATGERANSWESMRATGVAFWQQDKNALVSLLEESAKSRFRESRDPDTVALIYAAIGKIPVLRGLYKTCNRTREAEFFSRDFSREANQIAASKNAFVLLGQHRYAMAATFFILGGKLRDAVEVCLHQMGDLQLAIVLYRTLGQDMDIGEIIRESLLSHEHLSAAQFLRHWVAGDLPGAVEALLTVRHPSEGAWLVQAALQLVSISPLSKSRLTLAETGRPGGAGGPGDVDPVSKLSVASTLSADVLSRNGMPLLGLEAELVAFVSSMFSASGTAKSSRKYGRWRNEASNACALAMVEAPVSLIPDLFVEDDFNQRIADLISRIEELQNLGIDVSTNVVLHRIEGIYKSLSYCQTVASPATPKSDGPSSSPGTSGISTHPGGFGGFGLGRTHSIDSQSRNSTQSSFRRTSLDDVHEHQVGIDGLDRDVRFALHALNRSLAPSLAH